MYLPIYVTSWSGWPTTPTPALSNSANGCPTVGSSHRHRPHPRKTHRDARWSLTARVAIQPTIACPKKLPPLLEPGALQLVPDRYVLTFMLGLDRRRIAPDDRNAILAASGPPKFLARLSPNAHPGRESRTNTGMLSWPPPRSQRGRPRRRVFTVRIRFVLLLGFDKLVDGGLDDGNLDSGAKGIPRGNDDGPWSGLEGDRQWPRGVVHTRINTARGEKLRP
jgi:hypothetical protein